jgi:hypothetical protein
MKRWLGALGAALTAMLVALVLIAHQARSTVSSAVTTVVALGNGATTVFNFPFIGVNASDIVVTYIDANGNQTVLGATAYTLALNAAPAGQIWGLGGTVTYPLSGSPIATGTQLAITRTVPLLQTTSLSNQGSFFPQAVEQAIDLVVLEFQGVATQIARSLQVSPNDTCNPLGVLPPATQRANQIIGFDSTGCNPIAAQPGSALVSAAMQPVVAAPTIGAATTLLGVNANFNTPVGAELDWPSFAAPSYWKLENGAHISRTTYSALLAVIAPVVSCTITSASNTITGIGSTAYPGLGTGWIIESPGSTAIAAGQTISAVGGTNITIAGGNATANASQCQVFPYGTAQDGTFTLPNAAGAVYAGLDTANTNLNATYCTGNPAYLNAVCGAQSETLAQANLPNATLSAIAAYNPGNVALNNGPNANQAFVQASSGSVSIINPGGTSSELNAAVNFTSANSLTVPVPAYTPSVYLNGNVTQTPFSLLQPTRIRNKIIFAGAP